jgi:UDP-N-acetylglucosamine 2-epimerase (non-hydrolysing)
MQPFPEEINRLITFRLANYYACPGGWALKNLKKYKGVKIDTGANTQIDTIHFGFEHADAASIKIPKEKYVVASIHRYENIFKLDRLQTIIDRLEQVGKKFSVYLIQHPATEEQLNKFPELHNRLYNNHKIHMLPRLEYLSFIKMIKYSEFVITDGGGNQEELYYIGKPTLLFRDETERQEGLGSTAVISRLDEKIIADFIDNYKKYEGRPVKWNRQKSPAIIITNWLVLNNFGAK